MFELIILKADGSLYWIEHFNDHSSAIAWITEEQTRSYYDPSYTYSIVDHTPIPPVLSAYQIALDLCHEQRRAEYPPEADYLDGIVKGDVAQQQAYIAACLAVKAKYPKPIE